MLVVEIGYRADESRLFFLVHAATLTERCPTGNAALFDRVAALDEADEDEDDGEDEQDMDEPTEDRKGDEAENPEDDEDDGDCDKHGILVLYSKAGHHR